MPLTLVDARSRAADLADVTYDLDLDLTDPRTFRSSVRVRFRSRSGATFLELADGRDVTVVWGTDDDAPAWSYDGARISVEGLPPAAMNEVTVSATLPYVTDGEGLHTFTDPVDQQRYVGAYLGVDLAQRVFACFDQPDVKAVLTLTVRADPAWTVLANGAETGRLGDRRTFAPTRPLPITQVVVCAGPWHSRTWTDGGRPFGWHCRASLADTLDRDFEDLKAVTTACFDHYARLFTPPYPFGSYHQIFVPGQNWGAQETPGCVMYRDELLPSTLDAATQRARAAVIAHEMSHMWFGNLATMRWYEDIWLNESFADYLGFRVAGEAAGYPDAPVGFEIARKPAAFAADVRRSTHPVAATATDVPDSAAAASNFDAISYAKGHVLIRQLSTWLGDEAFFAGVNAYLERFAFANAGLDDFVACLAAAAPERDVTGWARSWLRTTGFDTLEVVDHPGEPGDSEAGADVGTTTDTTPRTETSAAGPTLRRRGARDHLVRLAAFDDSLTLCEVRDVEVGAAPVDLAGWQDRIVLPNADGGTFAMVRPRPADDARLRQGVSRLADPVHRAQVWSSFFVRLHLGEVDPTELFTTVREQLADETDPSIVQAVVAWTLGRGLQLCRAAETVLDGYAALADAARTRLSPAHPGPRDRAADPAFVQAAVRTSDQADELSRWYEQGRVGEVPLSADDRWVLVWRMTELGLGPDDLVAAASAGDGSAQAADWAARARAAAPDEAARSAAWALVQDEQPSNRRLQAVLQGLWSSGRGSVPDEQVTAYLTGAPGLAARRGPGFAALLGSYHPGLALTPQQADLLAGALDGDLDPRLRRQWQDWADDLSLISARSAVPR